MGVALGLSGVIMKPIVGKLITSIILVLYVLADQQSVHRDKQLCFRTKKLFPVFCQIHFLDCSVELLEIPTIQQIRNSERNNEHCNLKTVK
jgi:hypothetical protein